MSSSSPNGWTRHGECRPNCGACCLVLIQGMTVRVQTNVREPAYWTARGIVQEPDGSVAVTGHLLAPCPQLTQDVRCGLQATGKPQYCQDYPTAPEQIVHLPCSYWFTNAAGDTIGGEASPYPLGKEVLSGEPR